LRKQNGGETLKSKTAVAKGYLTKALKNLNKLSLHTKTQPNRNPSDNKKKDCSRGV
jgi:hypothetical protein